MEAKPRWWERLVIGTANWMKLHPSLALFIMATLLLVTVALVVGGTPAATTV